MQGSYAEVALKLFETNETHADEAVEHTVISELPDMSRTLRTEIKHVQCLE